LLKLYEEYKVTQDPSFLRNNPLVGDIIKKANALNKDKRLNNYELDHALWLWDFVNDPINAQLRGEVRDMSRTPANMYSRQALDLAFQKEEAEGEGNILPGPKQFSVR
jgi:hypothetical protein